MLHVLDGTAVPSTDTVNHQASDVGINGAGRAA
jgi:hypothetical protein